MSQDRQLPDSSPEQESPRRSTLQQLPVSANGWEDASSEGARLLPRGGPVEMPLGGASSQSPSGDAEQWQTISGLLLYALCTLCSSGAGWRMPCTALPASNDASHPA